MKFLTILFTASFATLSLTQAPENSKPADFLMLKSPEQYAANAALSKNIFLIQFLNLLKRKNKKLLNQVHRLVKLWRKFRKKLLKLFKKNFRKYKIRLSRISKVKIQIFKRKNRRLMIKNMKKKIYLMASINKVNLEIN